MHSTCMVMSDNIFIVSSKSSFWQKINDSFRIAWKLPACPNFCLLIRFEKEFSPLMYLAVICVLQLLHFSGFTFLYQIFSNVLILCDLSLISPKLSLPSFSKHWIFHLCIVGLISLSLFTLVRYHLSCHNALTAYRIGRLRSVWGIPLVISFSSLSIVSLAHLSCLFISTCEGTST